MSFPVDIPLPRRNIRPRPIDVELPMPVLHLKDDQCSEEDDITMTTTTTTTTSTTTTVTTTTTTKTKGRKKEILGSLTISISSAEVGECSVCGKSGSDMIWCDGCPRIFHLECLEIPMSRPPKGPWLCNNKHDEIYYQSKNLKNKDELISVVPPTVEYTSKEEVPIPAVQEVADYEETTLPNFTRPNSYLIYKEPSAEAIDRIIDYEIEEEDETFIANLATEKGVDISEEKFEAIINLLEVEANKKKLQPSLPMPFVPIPPPAIAAPLSAPSMSTSVPPASKSTALESNEVPVPISQSNSFIDIPLPSISTDDIICGVCGNGESDEFNMIVLCDGCDIAVHQLCYGIQQIPHGEWKCDLCLNNKQDAVCEICSQPRGGMKPTSEGSWGHVVCGIWIPETSFGDAVLMQPIDGVSNISRERAALICSICNTPGACIQCKEPDCYEAYHPFCALQARYHMEIRRGLENTMNFETFCENHSEEHIKQDESMSKTTGSWVSGDAPTELKMACNAVAPLIRKKFRLAPPIVETICKYWIEKRIKRNRPLLPRFQEHSNIFHSLVDEKKKRSVLPKQNRHEQYLTMRSIRHGMEHARTLLNLLKRREDSKRELLCILTNIVQHQITTGEGLPADQIGNLYTDMMNKQQNIFGFEDGADLFDLQEKKKRNKPTSKPEKHKRQKTESNSYEDDHEYIPDLPQKMELPSSPGQGEVFNLHCHHCKKRRPRCAVCPFNATHRYCQNCVHRHFGINYEELAKNTYQIWENGCPRCAGTCPCAVCRLAAGVVPLTEEEIQEAKRERKRRKREFKEKEEKKGGKRKSLTIQLKGQQSSSAPSETSTSITITAETKTTIQEPKRRGRPPKYPMPKPTPQPVVQSTYPSLVPIPHSLEPLFDIGFPVDHMFLDLSTMPSMPTMPTLHLGANSPLSHTTSIKCDNSNCKGGTRDDKILRCDKCNKGYHAFCSRHPLLEISPGTWYCNNCEDAQHMVVPITYHPAAMTVHSISLASPPTTPKRKAGLIVV